jgi:hypothetical protein
MDGGEEGHQGYPCGYVGDAGGVRTALRPGDDADHRANVVHSSGGADHHDDAHQTYADHNAAGGRRRLVAGPAGPANVAAPAAWTGADMLAARGGCCGGLGSVNLTCVQPGHRGLAATTNDAPKPTFGRSGACHTADRADVALGVDDAGAGHGPTTGESVPVVMA